MANTLNLGDGNWATKEGSLLGYNSENNNYKPLPFTFDRASSATRVNKDGLIETVGADQPRVDYLNDSKGALLLEPSRTNLIQYSEDFSNAYWTKNGTASVTNNTIISPDGTLNASTLSGATGDTLLNVLRRTFIGLTTEHTLSIYVKSLGASTMSLIMRNGVSGNIRRKSISLNDEWQRVDLSHTIVDGQVCFGASDGDFAIWAAQLEEGYPTSYIPTQGSAVTRLAETASQTTPDGVIGQTEGTMYAEIDFKSKPENGSPIVGIMTLNNDVNNLQNCIILGIERQSGGINRFYPFVNVGNSTVAFIIGGTLTDGNYKVAFAYKQNDFILYVNGVQIGTDTNGAVPTTSQVLVGERYNSDTFKIADGIKETKLYNTRLSNSELAALTQV